jgi:hypothetical protein
VTARCTVFGRKYNRLETSGYVLRAAFVKQELAGATAEFLALISASVGRSFGSYGISRQLDESAALEDLTIGAGDTK